jgi:hydrogenase maturation protease
MNTLVIGYGNRSRGDDGVGWDVAERLECRDLPGVEVCVAHQLEVDLAEDISRADRVIFVDAAVPEVPQAVTRSAVGDRGQAHAVAHYLTPSDLLELGRTLYGARPEGILYSIRGHDFEFGERLSPETDRSADEVVDRITELVTTGQPSVSV